LVGIVVLFVDGVRTEQPGAWREARSAIRSCGCRAYRSGILRSCERQQSTTTRSKAGSRK
jgi:hypothetical protein